jgi:glycosyltransferase involved in cell wall biosynthesis
MRLLSVNMTLDPKTGGGSAARTLQVSRVLSGLGVSCAVASTDDGPGTGDLEADGIRWVRIPAIGGRFRIPIGGFSAIGAAVREADVVMLVNHWTLINVLAWRAAVAARRPYVICPAGALPLDGGRSRWLKVIYNALAGRRIVAQASAHIAVTDQERAQFGAYGIDPTAVTVVPNGMPHVPTGDGAAFRARHGIPDVPILLFMGRLAPIKGPDLLIDAFRQCADVRPDWHLVVAGPDDGMLAELRERVSASGLSGRVHFTGYLDATTKPDALAAAGLVVVPSRREAMSIVVLEAASAARAVLVTDQCGIPDVESSGGGWVVPATAEDLSRGIVEATADAEGLINRGRTWRDAATARYGWATIGQRYIDLFSKVVADSRR